MNDSSHPSSSQQPNDIVNVSIHLKKMAEKQPFKRAVVCPAGRDSAGRVTYSHLTFAQLDKDSDRIAAGLIDAGISRGTRTILMVTPSIDFFSLTFALFKAGAVPVVVDPGMGIDRMLSCLKESRAEAFIGIPKAHILRVVKPGFFKNVRTWVTVGKKWFWGGLTLTDLRKASSDKFESASTTRDETAAVLFTTGSTGPAKGVVYTHGTFDAQVRTIRNHFKIGDNEIDLPTFPLFALFDPALGMTAVIPDMDPTKPAHVNPERIIEAIENQGVTNMFASPALLNRVGRYGNVHGSYLPSLKRVVSAGAPVAADNIRRFVSLLPEDGRIHTPYGATEAVPILSITSPEILSETGILTDQGHGICVGRPIGEAEIRLIRITDEPISQWTDDLVVSPGEPGEIVVSGALVTTRYFERPDSDALAKISDNGRIWHRMGDLGWQDSKGRIWFCGRKAHRVSTANGDIYTVPCEAVFNTHPSVYRSALVGVGNGKEKTPVICIECQADNQTDTRQLESELLQLAQGNPVTEPIRTVLFHSSFPVDIRHNAKIFREKLGPWAAEKMGIEPEET